MRVASFDIHYLNYAQGTLILERDFTDSELEELIARLDHEIVSSAEYRSDFILSVYRGKEIGFYSDVVTDEQRRYDPVVAKDIEHVSEVIRSALGKSQAARGKLNEYIAVEFFKAVGYVARRAGIEMDHEKVDVIAERDGVKTYVQVKSGRIGDGELRKFMNSVAEIDAHGEKRAAIVARSFSPMSEFVRTELQAQHGFPLQLFDVGQVLELVPEFKKSIG